MSLTAPEQTGRIRIFEDPELDPPRMEPVRTTDDDMLLVICAVCDTRQYASGRALGYTCHTCGSVWQVLRCRECRKASVVLEGVSTCPCCGVDRETTGRGDARTSAATWLTDPSPLSVWLGGVKYLGGHAERDQPVGAAGLLLDRRGIHLRAFAELFSIGWDDVHRVDIEGPQDISERMTTTRLLALGATTWALQVSYLTVNTAAGDAVFEVEGLSPPALHARLSRVLQGLQQSEHPPEPITLGRRTTPSLTPVPTPAPAPEPSAPPEPITLTAPPEPPAPRAIDPEQGHAPLEVLVVDALWKLAHLREIGLLDETELRTLRARLLARIPELAGPAAVDPGPLLHV